jgi:alkanesulfonate monooxygenase SsuD/methylene tetrahydromethanopterin reductase-like flavin-dependent oxidoreductase (luciferase family)
LRDVFTLAKALGTASCYRAAASRSASGLGWMEEEFDLVGQPFAGAPQRGEEMIEVMRKLWTGEMVEHHGRHFDFPRLQMSPAVPGRDSIFVGGRSEVALRRVARIADGWNPDILSRDELAKGIAHDPRCARSRGAGEPLDVIAAPKDGFDVDAYRRLEDIGVTHCG